jgi:hypothetical protein
MPWGWRWSGGWGWGWLGRGPYCLSLLIVIMDNNSNISLESLSNSTKFDFLNRVTIDNSEEDTVNNSNDSPYQDKIISCYYLDEYEFAAKLKKRS